MTATLLTRRRRPVQDRARQTVEQVLDAAAALLEESGLESFNTNALADRAGVRVRTVYRYFPNKLAVITALAERMAVEWDGWFDRFRGLAEPGSDWHGLWGKYIDAFVDGVRATPGGLAIRHAMRALPELQAIDRADNDRLARHLAAALRSRAPEIPPLRLRIMSRLLIDTAVAALDSALLEPRAHERAMIAELKRLHLAYIDASIPQFGKSR